MSGKNPTAFENLVIWIVIPVLATANQLVQKYMAIHMPQPDLGAGWIVQIIQNPWMLGVLFLEITTFILWIGVLANVNLSRATPITSIAYMMIAIISWLWFGENVEIRQLIGIVLIIAGLHLLHRTDKKE